MIERIPSSPPQIVPVPENINRPLWSVMIPVYNCSRFLEKTIHSVLQQYPGADKMQIEVVDDCSTDTDVETLVAQIGQGIVTYYRKETNLGSIRNFETCINRAKGHLIHLLHGDDYVLNGFYEEIEKLFNEFPEIGAAFTDFYFVDIENQLLYIEPPLQKKAGVVEKPLENLASKQRIQPPSMVVKRSVYEHLGSFFAVKYGEDWEMWVRIASKYPIAHDPRYLACYRVHEDNITNESLVAGQNIKDTIAVMKIINEYLPINKRKALKKQARKNFGIYFAWLAHKLYHVNKNYEAAKQQSKGAVKMYANWDTLILMAKLYVKLLIKYKQ